jgi:chromosome segregation ATPase
MWRGLSIGICAAVLVLAGVHVRAQRPQATLDELLGEIRDMRADVNRVAAASVRIQIVIARVTLQGLRMGAAAQRLASVRQQLAESRLRLAPSIDQIKPALETNSEILAPLRYTVQQEQRRNRELKEEESELVRAVDSEESRWSELNSQLEELERVLSR